MARVATASPRPGLFAARGLMGLWAFLACWVVLTAGMGVAHADTVRVRADAHNGYGRITFVWPQPVGHTVRRSGNDVVVQFSRKIEGDLTPIVRRLGKYVRGARINGDGFSVTLALKGAFAHRDFDSANMIVVDLIDGPAQSRTPTGQGPPAAKAPMVGVRTGIHPGYSRIVFDWPKTVAHRVEVNGAQARIVFGAPATIALGSLQGGRLPYVLGAETQPTTNGVAVVLTMPPGASVKSFAVGTKIVVDVLKPSGGAALTTNPSAAPPPTSIAPSQSASRTEPPPPTAAPRTPVVGPVALTPPQQTLPQSTPPTAGPTGGPAGNGQNAPSLFSQGEAPAIEFKARAIKDSADSVTLRFDWTEPVGAAVFRRAGNVWAVFDKPVKFNVADLKAAGGNIIKDIAQVPSSRGAVLRMNLVQGVNPALSREGFSWMMTFKKQNIPPPTLIESAAQPNSPLGARIFLSVPGSGTPVAFTDSTVGDTLVAIPVIPLGHGVGRAYSYPQVRLLPTVQGIVIQPLVDDLRIRSLRQGVELTSVSSLYLSPVTPEQAAGLKLGAVDAKPLSKVLDLSRWGRPDDAAVLKTKHQLLADVSAAPTPQTLEKARLNLARFFFANGFNPEALGIVELVAQTRPKIVDEPNFLLLRGAIRVMMGRDQEAQADLNSPLLKDIDEATFWRAALLAGEDHLAVAAPDLRHAGAIVKSYPKALKMPLGTLVAEANVEMGDAKQAAQYLEALNADKPSKIEKARLDYVDGKLKELSGKFDAAVKEWEKVEESRNRPARAQAAVARTELLLREKKYTTQQAIDELEKLRFAWRGDNFEFRLLRRLGDLYLSVGKYRQGLRTLRQAVTHFRDNPEAAAVTKKMTEVFDQLYLGGRADALAPVTAIALYDEFRELTPPGARGDEMIRKLADRLVGVDLLGRAAALLESQVDFRLSGAQLERVGARLALIYIMNKEYDKAIAALKKSASTAGGAELGLERTRLQAHALMGLDRSQEALNLLKDDKSVRADQLRMEIYWRSKDWKGAARALKNLVRLSGAKPRKPLNEEQSRNVLALAVAETLSSNERAVAILRADFGPAMAQTPFKDAFSLITSPPNQGLIDYRRMNAMVATVDSFQGFLNSYLERLKKGDLSAIF